jgi:hypothetical protein
MKAPTVHVLHPKWRKPYVGARLKRLRLDNKLRALRIKPETYQDLNVGIPAYVMELLEEHEVLTKRLQSYAHFHTAKLQVRCTASFMFFGKESVDMRLKAGDTEHALLLRLFMWLDNARGGGFRNSNYSQAKKLLAYWRFLHPLPKVRVRREKPIHFTGRQRWR